MSRDKYVYDWSDLAFASKKPLSSLHATLIMAPREMSRARLLEIVKAYLPKGHIIFGIAKESYVLGFEDQSQFAMLPLADIDAVAEKIAKSDSPNKIYILNYFQREFGYIVDKLDIVRCVTVNGSYKLVFHNHPAYFTLASKNVPIEHISPFCDEDEAEEYLEDHQDFPDLPHGTVMPEGEIMEVTGLIATCSYDYCSQVGAVLAKKTATGYRFITCDYNSVLPTQWSILHNGSEREKHFSPTQDINHHDSIHAEMRLLVNAQKNKLSLAGTTLFTNLMPCPACARVLCQTDIDEFVYQYDYAEGYAVRLFEQCGKSTRRYVPKEES